MKSSAFGERAREFSSWFLECNQCEQTIALYSLLTKVSATQARFFSLVLEHILQGGQDKQELARMEADANDPGKRFIKCFTHDTAHPSLSIHMSSLPFFNLLEEC